MLQSLVNRVDIMTLSDIKKYLVDRQQATVMDIANHFYSQPEIVKDMLQHWLRKGKIEQLQTQGCSGCNKCDGTAMEIYRWII